jgi:hypothetical protein
MVGTHDSQHGLFIFTMSLAAIGVFRTENKIMAADLRRNVTVKKLMIFLQLSDLTPVSTSSGKL